MTEPVILWLRRDLRLGDQAALLAACAEGPVVPVYVMDDETPGHRRMGAASRWWLHGSLASLAGDLRASGSRLVLRRGRADEVLPALAREVGARRVHALHHYEPWWRNAERAIARVLDLVLHDGNYLHPPGLLKSGSGSPYRIFTPFWRALRETMPPPEPMARTDKIPAPSSWPASEHLDDWSLRPSSPDWATGMAQAWQPGEQGALDRLEAFADSAGDYDVARNLPSVEGSSRLSPHLHFGEISPSLVWHRIARRDGRTEPYLRELAWRDYAQTVILQHPRHGSANGRAQFDDFPWRDLREAAGDFEAWKRGRTGYPIVDAGMRQLWTTGWMHNRVRMIAASFLVKHLLIDWRHGEQWFWDTLIDADYGNNSVNWQWVAGTGIDSSMFVRIMAPLGQSAKFDAADYIRRWVPELAGLPDGVVHDPESHGFRPSGYPARIIDHRAARERALSAYATVRA
ncbi:cryptochrome/photolyase family protein [Sphingobium lignivorans]|uniref:Deoxyribodipyrimidine photo-lyase n=1 Tax=Sphingobium lignivorans TaxID=2735886 RepID=A0ABR6NEW5_9SPHN|nr:deoxyribodipyrimidine photo-lyase [Sphingobium lignivorans]MBB5985811.1 deoxyribodipyrimidine photo-lyase [Sphingobium lignivorans]